MDEPQISKNIDCSSFVMGPLLTLHFLGAFITFFARPLTDKQGRQYVPFIGLSFLDVYRLLPSLDNDEGEEEDAEEGAEADDEGDADGVLAVDIQSRRKRGPVAEVIKLFFLPLSNSLKMLDCLFLESCSG
jgi:hypothetical protein